MFSKFAGFSDNNMASISDIRSMFPALERKVYGKSLVYLDNAATGQRLSSVIEMWDESSRNHNSNLHRAVHLLASEATEEYESARDAIRQYINAESREEVIFTSGTTASINLVAYSFGEAFVREGSEIIVTEVEHHSNIVPWQLLCQRKGAFLKVLPVDDDGYLRIECLEKMINDNTAIVCVSHISNVLGIVNPVKEIVRICHLKGIPVLIDGAQGVVHCSVDVQDLDCDFYAFSGHKIYAATGTGVLYGKKRWLEAMPPFLGGGEMVGTVKFSGTTYAPLPMKFEAGTQNFSSAITIRPALEFLKSLNDKELTQYYEKVKTFVYDSLINDKRIRLFGVPRGTTEDKIPLFSFCVEGVHHEDLALILDKMGIATRSGQMCAEPIMDRFGVSGMLRASFAPYNTIEEAEYFIECLNRAIKMLR